ncbi:MAG: O-methyltransferase [Gaiellaceae bacterium]
MTGGGSSIPEVQRLLAVLAAGRRCAEMGTAFGEGAAAIASTAASLVTVERDPARVAVARERLARLENVELLEGDWRELLHQRGPFELLFLDSGDWKEEPYRQLALDLVEPAGLLVKDDLTPGLPGPDPVREWFFGHPGLLATEILTTPETAAIVGVKRR